MELWMWIAGILLLGLIVGIVVVARRSRPREVTPPAQKVEPAPRSGSVTTVTDPKLTPGHLPKEPVAAPSELPNLSLKLSRTRGTIFGRLEKFFGGKGTALNSEQWQEIEDVLLQADVGIQTAGILISQVRERLKVDVNGKLLRDLIQEEAEGLLALIGQGPVNLDLLPKPYVISIVGVNGVGKTTTIGKLGHYFASQGKSVLLGAGDTFRAAAIDQLRIWSERVGAQFVAGREGGDPGAVAFDAVTAAKARGIDVVLLDTAGRLHTKTNLMDELKKVHRVVKKVILEAPHETWLILDGTIGQNSVHQAREFQKTLELTGVIVTKLDGTAKGGAVLSVTSELKLPIRFIGVGEGMGDFIPFQPKAFVQAILGA
jgi:fused signal recognition particle receptor